MIGADGLITFVDRLRDCIRRRGQNISAVEIEAVIESLPEVAAVAVSADIPGAEDEILLALVATSGAVIDCASIMRRATERLPRFAVPRYIRIMEDLPTTATGKCSAPCSASRERPARTICREA